MRILTLLILVLLAADVSLALPDNPILFVTQTPQPADFTTIGSTFGNHLATVHAAPRGGDLWIRYGDGTLKNLTAAAGYGVDGFQDQNGIAVRDPTVHWSGQKALFSMVIGSPEQYDYNDYRWQIYEISGLGVNDSPQIVKIANQPATYNNVSPIYGSDDSIIFSSDRPINGMPHLYPQLDEYEEAPTVSGLWKLAVDGALTVLDHAPSGDFDPLIDSYGRLLFTRWDHLQTDQQAADDFEREAAGEACVYCTFDWSSEAVDGVITTERVDLFPEPRYADGATPINSHSFNHFFPWMIAQDGSELETLNHVGRHELHDYFNRAFDDDPRLVEFIGSVSGRVNPNPITNFFQMAEDPLDAGRYIAIDAPEFATHAAGQIVALQAAPADNPDEMVVDYITDPATRDVDPSPPPNHSGLYRNPLPLSNGELLAVHTAATVADENLGTRARPQSRYDFRIKLLQPAGDYFAAATALTAGISETISYYDPDVLVSYSGELWELQPVEVVARSAPPLTGQPPLPAAEAAVFSSSGVDPVDFQSYLTANDLALIVSRNVTTRDAGDRQQPFDLAVAGGVGSGDGARRTVQYLQLFQADLLRSLTYGGEQPRPGRRVLARPLHDVPNPPSSGAAGSVAISADGSVAALVPAGRAVTWQLTAPDNTPVVRERYWLTLQAGEVRVCGSCHGVNSADQDGNAAPLNQPQALAVLLDYWQTTLCDGGAPPDGCTAVPTGVALQAHEVPAAHQRGLLPGLALLVLLSAGVLLALRRRS